MRIRTLFLSIMLLAFCSIAVFAQSSEQNDPTTTSGQQGSDSQKCIDVTKKVGLVTDRYDQNKEKYMNAFENAYQNMNTLMLKFKAEGYDTAQLEDHLEQYNNMIQNISRYYNEFRTGIDNSKKGVCGNSDADAGQEFNNAREQLMNCKNEMLQLRTFALETLKQDLLELKTQVSE